MGGGDKGGGVTPTTPPGYTGGSVTDYTPPIVSPSPVVNSTGPNYYGVIAGTALQGFGKGIGAGMTPPSAGVSAQVGSSPSYETQQQSSAPIPQNNLLDALMRILSGA